MLTGCARCAVTTTVNADGSFKRVAVYSSQRSDKPGTLNLTPKVEDVFDLPTDRGVTVVKTQTSDEISYRATRTIPLGQVLKGDVTVRSGKPNVPPRCSNEMLVHQIAPGRLEYRETIHWSGPSDIKADPVDTKELEQAVKSALPSELVTPENTQTVIHIVTREMYRMLFGPPDPQFTQLITNLFSFPDVAAHQIVKSIGPRIDRALGEKFGARFPKEKRVEFVKSLAESIMKSARTSTQAKISADQPPDKDSGPGAALAFIVHMPGKVVETNGEYDEYTGDVYWALFPESAALGDVVLTATCDTSARAESLPNRMARR
jgi:hypothetical protein